MSLTRPIDFERYNPFRRPDWRHERVLRMVDRTENPGRSTPRDDKWVKGLRHFILRYRNGDDAARNILGYENPGLYWAYQVFERRMDDPEVAVMIEARILAGQTDEEICQEIHTIPEAIEWYEALFFHVRDRRTAHDWIVKQVLLPTISQSRLAAERRASQRQAAEANAPGVAGLLRYVKPPCAEPFFDATVKFFAYFGGPLILEYVLSGFRRGAVATTREEIGNWFDQHWMHRIKHRSAAAAATFEVDKYTVMQLFDVHARIIEIERSAESADQAQSSIDRCIAGMMEEMPWTVGKDGETSVKGTALEVLDTKAMELRDHELLMVGAGQHPISLDSLDELTTLPPPRQRLIDNRENKDGNGNSDAQQGS